MLLGYTQYIVKTAFRTRISSSVRIHSRKGHWVDCNPVFRCKILFSLNFVIIVPRSVIADEYVINARNSYKNRMHAEGIHRSGWYSNRTEIDYRGSDVTIQNFMDSLLGFAPKSLDNLNEESSLMIYLTGHGGDQFFKFQDEVRHVSCHEHCSVDFSFFSL